ncbi:MAG: HAD-IA family hydrolase [Phycisphaerae bacterium]|nr:HAD-IA family hydrolase [Phycisphaerae bacterium]
MPAGTLPSTNSIRLVCFDLGRVLIRVRDSWADACRAAGVPIPAALSDPNVLAKMSALRKRAEHGLVDAHQYAEEAAGIFGLTPTQVLDVSAAWLRGPYPGAVALLEEVCATGIQTACLTNTNDHHWQLLDQPGDINNLGLERLTYRFASHLIGHAKPDPLIYQHVESSTGIPPRQIVLFDDRPDNCQSASGRGWHAHRVEPSDDPVAEIRAHLLTYGVL